MGSLPPSGVVVTRVRRTSRSAIALLAALVVVMLLLAGLAIILPGLTGPVRDGGDAPVQPPETILVVGTDLTWRNVSAPLDRKVQVQRGASLTLEDCDITVDLEDLVTWDSSAITVSPGGGLVMLRSRLRLLMDQNLTDAYVTTEDWGRWSWQWGSPSASRVVNLMHARHPVLAFNASARYMAPDLLVMGQSSTSDTLSLLARLSMTEGAWERYEVDLTPITGGVARVAVAPMQMTDEGAMFLADMRVLEDGEVPYGDIFATGDALEDGWHLQGFERFIDISTDEYVPRVPALVYAEGVVRLHDSSIEAPGGVPRRVDAYDGRIDWTSRQQMGPSQFHNARIGAHLEVAAAGLEVAASRLVNVPVRTDGSWVYINASRLEGDADLLTMRGCTGGLRSCSLLRGPMPDIELQRSYSRSDRTWAVCSEGGVQLSLLDCDIEGGRVCLYLEGGSATVEGCALLNATESCMWAHDVSGLGGWSHLNRTNSFAPMAPDSPWDERYAYIETSECTVRGVFDNTTDEFPVEIDSDTVDGSGELARLPLVSQLDGRLSLKLPSLLVRGDLVELPVPNLTLEVWCYPFEVRLMKECTVERGTEALVVRFDRRDLEEARAPASIVERNNVLGYNLLPGAMAGEVMLNVSITQYFLDDIWIDEPLVRIWLDGETMVMLEVTWDMHEYSTHVDQPLVVPPGHHTLEIQLLGRAGDDIRPETLCNESLEVLRVNGSVPAGDIVDMMGSSDVLLVDPGTDLVLERMPTWGDQDYLVGGLSAALWPGSNLTLEGISAGPDELPEAYLSIIGPGGLALRNWTGIGYIILHAKGLEVRLGDMRTTDLSIYGEDTAVVVEGPTFEGVLGVDGSQGNVTVVAHGCTFIPGPAVPSAFYAYEVDAVSLRDCALLAAGAPASTFLMPNGPGVVLMEDCLVRNTTVLILPERDWSFLEVVVGVRGCVFEGEGSYLVVASRKNGTVFSEGVVLDATGNSFTGPGTGAVLASGLVPGFLENDLGPGSGLLAFHPFRVGSSGGDWYRNEYFDVLGLGPDPPFKEAIDNMGIGQYFREWMHVYDLVGGEAPFAYDGRELTFVVRSGEEVLWFTEAAVVGPEVDSSPGEWPDLDASINNIKRRFLDDVDWWGPT